MQSKKQKVLIYGGSGQIGSHAILRLPEKFDVIHPSHSEVDVTAKSQVEQNIKKERPDQILYAAGYTNTDAAKHEPGKSFWLNAGAIMNITHLAAKMRIPVYYLSTEIVFDGTKTESAYTEKDTPNPLLTNGKTKRLGELATLDASKQNCVVRLIMCISPYYERKKDLARLVVSKLTNHETFTATDNQTVNPIYVDHLITALRVLLQNRANGIYHVGATDFTTPYKFARKLAQAFGLNKSLVQKTTFEQFSKTRPEPRPQHQWLDTTKFRTEFGEGILHSVEEGIAAFKKDYIPEK